MCHFQYHQMIQAAADNISVLWWGNVTKTYQEISYEWVMIEIEFFGFKLSAKIQNSSRYHQITFWNTAVGNSWKELKTLYCKKNANSEYLHPLGQASNVLHWNNFWLFETISSCVLITTINCHTFLKKYFKRIRIFICQEFYCNFTSRENSFILMNLFIFLSNINDMKMHLI